MRKTVKLSESPRPSTESAKHNVSTINATRAGLAGSVTRSSCGVFWSIADRERASCVPSKRRKRMGLCRLEQDVTLLAQRQLDHAFRREIRVRQRHALVGHRRVVDTQAAALDLPPRFAVRGKQPRFDEGCQQLNAGP